jgi:glycosyltransferase involved in cell wall biosynthesis
MSPSTPLVSIITIVFNGELHLEQTIKSVLEQTYHNIEYIVIDGGSTDNSVSIIKKYSDKLAYWISEKDKGISDAFNKGISRATGEIVGLINADDWYEPDAVEKVVSAIKGYDIAYGKIAYWKNEKKEMITYGRDEFLLNEMSVNHPTVFVRREIYKKFGVFNTTYKFAMDYDLVLRLKINRCQFVYIPSVLANMRWDGASDKHWYKACKEALQIKNHYLPKRKLFNSLFFLKQVGSIKFGRLLQKLHLDKLVHFYRRTLSPVKKIHS